MAQDFTKITFFDIIIDIDAIEGEHYIFNLVSEKQERMPNSSNFSQQYLIFFVQLDLFC